MSRETELQNAIEMTTEGGFAQRAERFLDDLETHDDATDRLTFAYGMMTDPEEPSLGIRFGDGDIHPFTIAEIEKMTSFMEAVIADDNPSDDATHILSTLVVAMRYGAKRAVELFGKNKDRFYKDGPAHRN